MVVLAVLVSVLDQSEMKGFVLVIRLIRIQEVDLFKDKEKARIKEMSKKTEETEKSPCRAVIEQ